MVFLLGVNFTDGFLVKKCLQSFYGIGPLLSAQLLAKFHIVPSTRIASLPNKTVLALNAELSTMNIETEKRAEMRANIMRLKEMGSYRGRRHAMGLPVRGQRTRTQIKTAAKLNKPDRKN